MSSTDNRQIILRLAESTKQALFQILIPTHPELFCKGPQTAESDFTVALAKAAKAKPSSPPEVHEDVTRKSEADQKQNVEPFDIGLFKEAFNIIGGLEDDDVWKEAKHKNSERLETDLLNLLRCIGGVAYRALDQSAYKAFHAKYIEPEVTRPNHDAPLVRVEPSKSYDLWRTNDQEGPCFKTYINPRFVLSAAQMMVPDTAKAGIKNLSE